MALPSPASDVLLPTKVLVLSHSLLCFLMHVLLINYNRFAALHSNSLDMLIFGLAIFFIQSVHLL